jgi:hypothetical protein
MRSAKSSLPDPARARVALHTRRDLVAAIVAKADSDHPYDVPCVIALPIVDANPAYVQWISGRDHRRAAHLIELACVDLQAFRGRPDYPYAATSRRSGQKRLPPGLR